MAIGRVVAEMGGGRRNVEDAVEPTVGFPITARPGQQVHTSEALASIFAVDAVGVELGRKALDAAMEIGMRDASPPSVVRAGGTAAGVEPVA